MAPIITPDTSTTECFNDKPLPQLVEQVMKAIKLEEERLHKEEAIIHATSQVRFSKPLAPVKDDSLSPPPSPPPKDNDDKVKERLSLEEDYPNRTIDPCDIVSTEYRQRTNFISNQWYFDEYSSVYRQNAPGLCGPQSMPSLQSYSTPTSTLSTADASTKPITENLPLSSSPISLIDASQSPSLNFEFSPLYTDIINRGNDANRRSSSASSSSHHLNSPIYNCNNTTTSINHEQQLEEWPSPRTVEQVHQLRKQARATRDRRKQLDLCRTLMDAACRDEKEHVTESPIPGTPPVNTRYRLQELRRMKKKDLVLDQVLVLEAQKILKQLALGGGGIGLGTDGDAQFLLANCYGVGGLGLPLDRERAFSLYVHASKQNHLESTYRAGVCYEIGIGTRKDYIRAMSFYRKAAMQSHVASMYKLAIILLRGYCGQAINVKEAANWLQRAAALANGHQPHAMYALAMFQLSKEFTEYTVADKSYALELLHRSAKLEYLPSQVKLGELYEIGGDGLVQVDDAVSIYWYSRAAEQGNADAALALSTWYLTGSTGILPQSDSEAYLWARKAASCQNADRWTVAKAYFMVGMCVEHRIGISDTSTDSSRVWFERAAALGHLGAMNMLESQEE